MILIGTSGFSFADWKNTIYPANLPAGRMLAYYALNLGFSAVEINSTYYRLPTSESMRLMERKTPAGFEFVVKAFKGMTHDPFDSRMETPDEKTISEYFLRFSEAIAPLVEAGKLGAVLLQFPVFFYPSLKSKEYLLYAKDALGNIPVVIEFRNHSWARNETFEFLQSNGLAYCAVDEPKLPRLMPFAPEVTSRIAYVRFHGRNPNWFNSPLSERYNYFYSDEELAEFVPLIRRMDALAGKTYVFFNNCHAGYAAKNARKFALMLDINTKNTDEDLFNY